MLFSATLMPPSLSPLILALYVTCLATDHGADAPPPAPKMPPGKPRKPKVPDEPANARQWAAYAQRLADYESSPSYVRYLQHVEQHRALMAARRREKEQRREEQRRGRQRDRGPDDGARRQRQQTAANARVPRTQQRRVAPLARNAPAMLALDAAEFDKAAALDIGKLGSCANCDEQDCPCAERCLCTHCGALLFRGEAKPTRARGRFATVWHGGDFCCSNGTVMLQAVDRCAMIETLWNDEPIRKLLKHYSRQLNNALALASTKAKAGAVPGRHGWNPSVVIQGKLHHYTGPLRAPQGATPQYAQLYINDPAANSDVVVDQRYARLRLPQSTSKPEQRRVKDLLRALTTALHECNPYIQDILTAGEIFEAEEVPCAIFVIDAQKAPTGRDKRTYSVLTEWPASYVQ